MSKAIEKIDRFLERYKQLCLEEGLFVSNDAGEVFLEWVEEVALEDNLASIKTETIREIPWNRKWKRINDDKG